MRNFTFRKLTSADLPLMQHWLEAPHVKAWWPDAERQVGMMLDDIEDQLIVYRYKAVNRIIEYFSFNSH